MQKRPRTPTWVSPFEKINVLPLRSDEAVSVAIVPAQTVVLLSVTIGFGFTVTVVDVLVVQVPYVFDVQVNE